MKRSPMPRRKSPLRSITPLPPAPGVRRRVPLSPGPGDGPRRATWLRTRPTVTAEERRARRLVKARAEGRCEGCGRPGSTDYSHRIGVGVGGPYHPANAVALDRACHSWLHANPAQARLQRGWRLQSTDNFLTFPAWVYGLGWVLLTPDGDYEPVRDIPEEIA